ncbi:hypothetical protein DPMN_015307, partial [Dreissena polymorpha]
LRVPERLASAFVVKRHQATQPTDINLTNYKRGTGGRSSFSGLVVTVFGCKGTLGYNLANRLGKIGSQVIIPYRGEPSEVRDLKLMGDLGQILFNPIELRDEDSIRKVCQYSSVVINCIGKEYETLNYTYDDVHNKGARLIARIAQESGVQRLIHVSALNAGHRSDGKYRPGGSQWLISKGEGEESVKGEFPNATIIRPAEFIDTNDYFTTYYLGRGRYIRRFRPFRQGTHYPKVIPLHNNGEAIRMPVLVRDVSMGIIAAMRDPSTAGKTYQCVGPHAYKLGDLVKFMVACHGQKFKVESGYGNLINRVAFREKVYHTLKFPYPKCTLDKLERETVSDCLDPSLPTLEDLGVTPENIEDTIYFLLRSYADPSGIFSDHIRARKPPTPDIIFDTLQTQH